MKTDVGQLNMPQMHYNEFSIDINAKLQASTVLSNINSNMLVIPIQHVDNSITLILSLCKLKNQR